MKLIGFAGLPTSTSMGDWRRYLTAQGYDASHAEHHAAESADRSWAATATAMRGAGVEIAKSPHTLIAIKGNARWKNAGASATPALQILEAYEREGDAFLERLEGGFALALTDLNRRRVLLALDRMGIERMTYRVQGSSIAYGTSAEEIARIPNLEYGLRQQALYDFLLLHMVPAPDTIFTGVRKLRPGTMLVFADGKTGLSHFWRPNFAESGPNRFDEWKNELHQSLEAAVRACAPDEHTGAFLSGGLDSSSVVGKLAAVSKHPARTFSMGFGVPDYDELSYARIAGSHFKCNSVEYDITPEDVVTALPLIARAYDEPFGNSSAVPTYFCALRARERGVTHMLAGDGGDEIFGGNERYVRQAVFERYRLIPRPLRVAVMEPLASLIPAEFGFTPLRKARSYIEQARIALPERLESWNFIYQVGLSNMLEPEFERSIDPRSPLATMSEVYHSAPADSMLHKMLYYDWHYTLSDNDLRKVGSMCELAGVRVSYPMLDQRVVDLSTRIPPQFKIEGGELRSFYKKATTGFLPQEILTKKKHGFGLPFGVWLKTHERLRELIYSLLSALKGRGIVQRSFIDRLIEQHQSGHASYYGYAIWDLAMLECWLQNHSSRAQ